MDTVSHKYSRYEVDHMAEEKGMIVCRLPPYHSELNPIELIWSQVKRHNAKHNVHFKASVMGKLIDDAFADVSEEQWKNYCRHVETV